MGRPSWSASGASRSRFSGRWRTGPSWRPRSSARSTPCSAAWWWRRSRCGRGSSATTSTSSTSPPTPAANLPPYYIVSAFWAGQKGSLLFWAVVLSLFASLAQLLTPRRYARPDALRRGSDVGGRGVLRERHAVRLQPVRAARLHARRRPGAQSAAAERRHGDPPADALPRLHQHHHPVRLRGRRAALPPARHRAGSTPSASGRW